MTEERSDEEEWEWDDANSDTLEAACQFRSQAKRMLAVTFPLLVISLFAFPYLEPNSPSRVLLVLDFGILGVMLVMGTTFLWVCNRHERERTRSFTDTEE